MSKLRKTLLILGAIVGGPVLLISMVVLAAGDWHEIGETGRGDKISISSVRILRNNLRTAWVRVEYKQPSNLPQGGPFVEMRARVRFNCKTGSGIASDEWFYSRDRSGKLVVSKKARRDDEFGKDSEGGFGQMVTQHVCQEK